MSRHHLGQPLKPIPPPQAETGCKPSPPVDKAPDPPPRGKWNYGEEILAALIRADIEMECAGVGHWRIRTRGEALLSPDQFAYLTDLMERQ